MFTGLTDGEDQDCTGERPQPGGPDPSSIQMSVSYTENALLYINNVSSSGEQRVEICNFTFLPARLWCDDHCVVLLSGENGD